jgi:hypothetical protein
MRRFATFVLLLTAAACTSKRATTPSVTYRPVVVQPTERGDLIGLTGDEVAARLGQPALQIREGDTLKLQFRGQRCVLDAYLYRGQSGQGALRVTHVDARDKDGRDVDQPGCLAELQRT